jgi:hypothetical protein
MIDNKEKNMQYLDKLGWPVVTFKGRPILNFMRRLLWTRKIKRGKFKQKFILDPSCTTQVKELMK